MSTRITASLLLALCLLLLVVAGRSAPAPARAAPGEPATTPLASGLQIDGYAIGFAQDGERLYPYGDFSYLGEAVSGLTVLDANGRIPPSVPRNGSTPSFGGHPGRVVPDGTGGWFAIVGSAESWWAAGVARLTSDMQLVAGWPVYSEGLIVDVALWGDTLYLAGSFSSISGQPRAGLAALDATSGALRPWTASSTPQHFGRLAVDDSTVYAAAFWDQNAPIVAFARDSGIARSWSPNISVSRAERMLVKAGRLYVAGRVWSDGASASDDDYTEGLVILDTVSGAAVGPVLRFGEPPNYIKTVFDIALSGDTIYLAGSFNAVNGQPRGGLAALNRADGSLLPWRADLVYEDPWHVEPASLGYTLSLDGDTLYVGGTFDQVAGQPRRNLAALHADTGALLPWSGSANRSVYTVAAVGERVAVGGIFTLAGGTASTDVAAIEVASGEASAWAAHHASGASSSDFDFGMNGLGVLAAVHLNNLVYLEAQIMHDDYPLIALDRESRAIHSWRGPSDTDGALAAGQGLLLVSRIISGTTALLAAYEPLGTTPRWERSVSGDLIEELLVVDDTVYGVASSWGANINSTSSIFAINIADGALRWQQTITGDPAAVAFADNKLYLGGSFERVGETTASNVAVLDPSSGALLLWPASLAPNGGVADLVIHQGRLYLGGVFTAIGANARPGLAAIDLAGEPTLAAWTPQLPAGARYAYALAITDRALYVSMPFTSAGPNRGSYGLFVYPMSVPAPTTTPTATNTPTSSATATSTPTATTTPPLAAPFQVHLPQLRR